MSGTALAIGQRIAEARVTAGLTQADLAAAVMLERSAIAKIETGTRKVSAIELSLIANCVGQRIEWFVDPSPASIVSHRDRQESGTTTARIDAELERVARDVEFVCSLDQRLIGDVLGPVPRPSSGNEAEGMAARARSTMGFDESSPILDLVSTVAKVGLLAFSAPLGSDTADAGTILLGRGAVSLVNSAGKVGRRRLALAHELGHYLVADEYTVDWRVSDHNASQRYEALLDRFARALLLPDAGLKSFWERCRGQQEDLRTTALRTASHYRVDMSTLARRLQELSLEGPSATDEVRKLKTTRADIVELDLLVPFDLEGISVPKSFELAVLRLFRSESISADRALELMRGVYEDADLPALPPVAESEIWKFTS